MNRKLTKKIGFGVTAAVLASGLSFVGAAFAEDNNLINQDKVTISIKGSSPINKDDNAVEQYFVGKGETLKRFFKEHNLQITDFQTVDNKEIDGSDTAEHNMTIVKKANNSDVNTIPIPITTIKKEDPNLYIGQEKVADQGEEGEAMITTITDTSTVDDKTIPTNTETINTIKPMRPKVILVGTKSYVTPTSLSTSRPSRPTYYAGGQGVQMNQGAYYSANNQILAESIPDATPIIEVLKQQVGKRYVWGATGPDRFDCSGLVWYIYRTLNGYNIPRTAYDQGRSGVQISYNDLQPGDVLYTPKHIAVYAGEGKVIHAANPRLGVIVSDLSYFMRNGFKPARLIK